MSGSVESDTGLEGRVLRGLPTENRHLSSTPTRMKSSATAAMDLQHALRGIQSGAQERGVLCSAKNWQVKPLERYL